MRTASAVSAPPAFWTMRAPIISICSSLSLSSVRASWLSVAWTSFASPDLPRLNPRVEPMWMPLGFSLAKSSALMSVVMNRVGWLLMNPLSSAVALLP
ncbi:hypothetical protein D3C79_951880 [compost metagenome]